MDDGTSVLFEYTLPDGTRSDYVLCDRAGCPMAALEAKHAGIDPVAGQDQGRHYAAQLEVPFQLIDYSFCFWECCSSGLVAQIGANRVDIIHS